MNALLQLTSATVSQKICQLPTCLDLQRWSASVVCQLTIFVSLHYFKRNFYISNITGTTCLLVSLATAAGKPDLIVPDLKP